MAVRTNKKEVTKEKRFTGLKTLLPACGDVKAQLKDLKAEEVKLVDAIKKEFEAMGITEAVEGGYAGKVEVIEKYSWIKEKLVEKIKAMGLTKKLLIPSVEVDEKLLEDMIYAKELNPADFINCQEKTEQTRLTIKAVK